MVDRWATVGRLGRVGRWAGGLFDGWACMWEGMWVGTLGRRVCEEYVDAYIGEYVGG